MLFGILLICALGNTALVWYYNSAVHQLADVQRQVMEVSAARNLIRSLVVDLGEYSKKNPSITPVLQSIGINLNGNAEPGAPARPGTK